MIGKKQELFRGAGILLASATLLFCCGTGYAQADHAAGTTEESRLLVLCNGQSMKKSIQIQSAFDGCIVPVMLVGSGPCKATLSAAEPARGEWLWVAAAGAGCGPYPVFDFNAAPADRSITAQVTIEKCGFVFFIGMFASPLDHFPKNLSFTIAF